MARIQAGSTLVNQYAPPFVVSDSVAQGWELQWNETLQAFEAIDPDANTIAAGFDEIKSALFENVTQQVFVVPFIPDTSLPLAQQRAQFIISIDGVKQHTDAYTLTSVDAASNTTTITLDEQVINETVEVVGLLTTGGATVNLFGPQGIDTLGTVDSWYDLSWYAPSKESLIVTVDGVKQSTSSYSIIPVPNSGYSQTRLTFPNRSITFLTDATGVNAASDFITTGNVHGFETGDGVYYSDGANGAGANIGLTNGTLYYVRRLSAFTLELYDNKVNAENVGFTTGRQVLNVSGAETHTLTRISDPYLYINGNTISLNVAGTGYAPSDVISINGGTPTTEALITVNTVGGGGEILTFTLSHAGEYVVFPSPITNVTTTAITGVGVNATFDIQKVSPQIEVIGISTTGETPASPVEAANLVEPDVTTAGSEIFGLYDNKTVTGDTQVLNFKSISAGANVSLSDAGTSIQINADVQRTFNQVGSGTSLFDGNDEDAEPTVFRRITGGDGIAISVVADTITVSVNREYSGIGTVDSPYTATNAERFIGINNVTGPIIINLPAASVVPPGEVLAVKDETGSVNGSDTITLQGPGAETIDGAADYTINTAYGFVELYSNGTNYFIISEG